MSVLCSKLIKMRKVNSVRLDVRELFNILDLYTNREWVLIFNGDINTVLSQIDKSAPLTYDNTRVVLEELLM